MVEGDWHVMATHRITQTLDATPPAVHCQRQSIRLLAE